jgi:hypothetical protein
MLLLKVPLELQLQYLEFFQFNLRQILIFTVNGITRLGNLPVTLRYGIIHVLNLGTKAQTKSFLQVSSRLGQRTQLRRQFIIIPQPQMPQAPMLTSDGHYGVPGRKCGTMLMRIRQRLPMILQRYMYLHTRVQRQLLYSGHL